MPKQLKLKFQWLNDSRELAEGAQIFLRRSLGEKDLAYQVRNNFQKLLELTDRHLGRCRQQYQLLLKYDAQKNRRR